VSGCRIGGEFRSSCESFNFGYYIYRMVRPYYMITSLVLKKLQYTFL
jgi:hypothetical protein